MEKPEIDDVTGGKDQPDQHAGDGTLTVHPFDEDPHEDRREKAGRCQAEGKRHHLGDKSGWVDAQVTGDTDRHSC